MSFASRAVLSESQEKSLNSESKLVRRLLGLIWTMFILAFASIGL